MSNKALVYGTIAIDSLITPTGQVNAVLGGSGVYAALVTRLLTSDMELVGVVGDDFPPEWGRALEARGVSMQHVAHAPGATFAWTGKYEQNMNNRETVCTLEGVQKHWVLELTPEQSACRLAVATNVTPLFSTTCYSSVLEPCSRWQILWSHGYSENLNIQKDYWQ